MLLLMNPRTWDLVICRSDNEDGTVDSILDAIKKTGFNIRTISYTDLMDKEFDSIPAFARFCSKELLAAGVENLFVPKPEFRDRILSQLSAENN